MSGGEWFGAFSTMDSRPGQSLWKETHREGEHGEREISE